MTTHLREDEFDDFYRGDHHRLCGYLHVRGATWEEALDIAHDTYVKLLEQFATIASPRAWTRRVAANMLTDLQRRRVTQHAALQSGRAGTEQSYQQPIIDDGEAERVVKLLQALPPRQREVIALTMDGYAPKEIAEFLGIASNTVSASLRLARHKLRDLIGESCSGGLS